MSVPMTTNLTKLRNLASSSQNVDSTLYRQLIGSLMYLVNMRPGICYIVNALSRFMSNPKHIHLVAAKHVLGYVRGTILMGSGILPAVEYCYLEIQIQIGLAVQLIEKLPLVIASV